MAYHPNSGANVPLKSLRRDPSEITLTGQMALSQDVRHSHALNYSSLTTKPYRPIPSDCK